MEKTSVYQTAVEAAKAGKRVKVYLREKYLRIDDADIVSGGKSSLPKFLSDEMLEAFDPMCLPNRCALEKIEELYERYKHSIPTEKTEAQRHPFFKALPESELSDDDMLYGERRDIAQVRLEAYILCAVLDGLLTWDEPVMGRWFYQSKKDKDLVILRSWIE